MKKLLVIAALVLGYSQAHAFEEGQVQLGLLGGNVTLLKDVGDSGSNALGYGVMAGVYSRDDLSFNLAYLMSDHDAVKHNEVNMGVDYYFNSFDGGAPFLSGGIVLSNNRMTIPQSVSLNAGEVSSSAFGLYAGGGVDFQLNSNIRAGVAAKYNFVFDADKNYGGTEFKTVQDNFTVLARIMFAFGKSTWW